MIELPYGFLSALLAALVVIAHVRRSQRTLLP
jgi:hypothetical protein